MKSKKCGEDKYLKRYTYMKSVFDNLLALWEDDEKRNIPINSIDKWVFVSFALF